MLHIIYTVSTRFDGLHRKLDRRFSMIRQRRASSLSRIHCSGNGVYLLYRQIDRNYRLYLRSLDRKSSLRRLSVGGN